MLIFASVISVCAMGPAVEPPTTTPIHALLITGHNNHNWPYTSRVHQETLEATGRFVVDLTEDPPTALADAAKLAQYQVFVLDYNDWHEAKRWGDVAEKNFAAAVRGGTGVVAIHSADNAFKGWVEYEQMLGLMWREGTGHGPAHDFDVQIVDHDHPITKGLSDITGHHDELYQRLKNPQNTTPHVLMQAMSETKYDGTGQNEPMAFTLEFGKGRIFATPLGHVWVNDQASKSNVLDPRLRVLIARGAEWAATGAVTLPATWSDTRVHNTLTAAEKAAGWQLLFDGTQASAAGGFRSFRQHAFPKQGWVVIDGTLTSESGKDGGGDLVTTGEYADFEFACEFKVAAGGNSGLIYHCTEDHDASYETGPEFQILDDAAYATAKPSTRCGALYDLYACAADVSRPAGEWNHARVICRGAHVEHWLNGVKVVDTEMAGDAYAAVLEKSKWAKVADFGKRPRGHIALQEHGGQVWFRDMKIREIK